MELFERVMQVIELKRVTRAWLATKFNVTKSTFNGYFAKEKQDRLLPHCYSIIKMWPEISRDWLFFGEGEMLAKDRKDDVEQLKADLKRTKKDLLEEQAMTRKLISRLLLDGNEKDTSENLRAQ